MGHAAVLVVGMFALQPACDLLRRPLEFKLNRYCPAERGATSELARLGAACAIPSRPIRSRSPIACAASIVPHLAADRRWRTSQLTGNRSKRQLRPQPSGDLLALGQPQRQTRPLPLRRSDPAGPGQKWIDRRRIAIEHPPDRTHRLPALPAIPDLPLLLLREINPSAIAHPEHSIFSQRLKCCGHPLNPPPKADQFNRRADVCK